MLAHELEHKLYQLNPDGELQLNFHPGQKQVWDSKKRFIFALAGTRSGKTSQAPWWLYREIMRTYTRGGKNDYLTVSPTVELFNNAFLPAMIEVFCEVLDIGYYWAAARTLELKCLDPQDERYGQFYEGPNGRSSGLMWARIILRSAQSEGALESMTAKAAVLDECGQDGFSLEDWEAVQRRVSIGQARILGTTTPYNLGWLYSTVYQQWLKGDPDIDIIQFPSYYNPSFDMAEFERARRSMPEWRFKLFYCGEFQAPTGLIYRDFDSATMIVRDEFPIPDSWERVVGVDFGGANTATVWLALNPNDARWYLYHTTLMGHLPTSEHAAIAQAEATGIERLTAIGGAKSEQQYRDDWYYAGFYIEPPPVSDVEVGIARVISLIKSDRLRVFNSCEGILNEIQTYRRKLDANNNATEVIIDKHKFHMCLVGDTLVETNRGHVQLQDIRVDDYVLTRKGYRRVLASAMTSPSSRVITVHFSDGQSITGTPEHKIYVTGKGYTALHALRYADIIETSYRYTKQEMSQCQKCIVNQSFGTDSSLIGIQTQNEDRIRSTFVQESQSEMEKEEWFTCIERFGNLIMGLYQRDTQFITRIITRLITILKTLRQSSPRNIWHSTWQRIYKMKSLLTACAKTWTLPELLLLSGIARQRVVLGTAYMGRRLGKGANQERLFATSAGKSTKRFPDTEMRSIVRLNVNRQPEKQVASATKSVGVLFAAKCVSPINTRKQNTAQISVLRLEERKNPEPVYNITVDSDPGEYFANGFLVRNCDALRAAAAWIENAPPGAEAVSYAEIEALFKKEGRYADTARDSRFVTA